MTTNNGYSYHELNAMLNLYSSDGKIQFEKDKEAAKAYFLDHVNQNTVFFHSIEEKLHYLVENEYYDKTVLDQYTDEFIKALFKQTYEYKFRFPTFVGAYKFYTSYALKTFDEYKAFDFDREYKAFDFDLVKARHRMCFCSSRGVRHVKAA
jgi:ribonucleotide reductase alpha subunit